MPTKNSSVEDQNKEILTAEFEYIASTANQANEDRARVSSFYLVAVGSLVAAIFSTQLLDAKFNMRILNLFLGGLFIVLTLLGSLTIMQLARLRGAWFDSMLAMNQIKEYAIGKDKNLEKAFRWRTTTAPKIYKVNSMSYQQSMEVALMSALIFGAAVYSFQVGIGYHCPLCNWAFAIAGALFAFLGQLYLYKKLVMGESKRLNL